MSSTDIGLDELLQWLGSITGKKIEKPKQLYDGTILLMVINKVLPLALPAASSRRVRGYASSSRDVSCNWQCIGLACKTASIPVWDPQGAIAQKLKKSSHRSQGLQNHGNEQMLCINLHSVQRGEFNSTYNFLVIFYFMHNLVKQSQMSSKKGSDKTRDGSGSTYSASFKHALFPSVEKYLSSQQCVSSLFKGGAIKHKKTEKVRQQQNGHGKCNSLKNQVSSSTIVNRCEQQGSHREHIVSESQDLIESDAKKIVSETFAAYERKYLADSKRNLKQDSPSDRDGDNKYEDIATETKHLNGSLGSSNLCQKSNSTELSPDNIQQPLYSRRIQKRTISLNLSNGAKQIITNPNEDSSPGSSVSIFSPITSGLSNTTISYTLEGRAPSSELTYCNTTAYQTPTALNFTPYDETTNLSSASEIHRSKIEKTHGHNEARLSFGDKPLSPPSMGPPGVDKNEESTMLELRFSIEKYERLVMSLQNEHKQKFLSQEALFIEQEAKHKRELATANSHYNALINEISIRHQNERSADQQQYLNQLQSLSGQLEDEDELISLQIEQSNQPGQQKDTLQYTEILQQKLLTYRSQHLVSQNLIASLQDSLHHSTTTCKSLRQIAENVCRENKSLVDNINKIDRKLLHSLTNIVFENEANNMSTASDGSENDGSMREIEEKITNLVGATRGDSLQSVDIFQMTSPLFRELFQRLCHKLFDYQRDQTNREREREENDLVKNALKIKVRELQDLVRTEGIRHTDNGYDSALENARRERQMHRDLQTLQSLVQVPVEHLRILASRISRMMLTTDNHATLTEAANSSLQALAITDSSQDTGSCPYDSLSDGFDNVSAQPLAEQSNAFSSSLYDYHHYRDKLRLRNEAETVRKENHFLKKQLQFVIRQQEQRSLAEATKGAPNVYDQHLDTIHGEEDENSKSNPILQERNQLEELHCISSLDMEGFASHPPAPLTACSDWKDDHDVALFDKLNQVKSFLNKRSYQNSQRAQPREDSFEEINSVLNAVSEDTLRLLTAHATLRHQCDVNRDLIYKYQQQCEALYRELVSVRKINVSEGQKQRHRLQQLQRKYNTDVTDSNTQCVLCNEQVIQLRKELELVYKELKILTNKYIDKHYSCFNSLFRQYDCSKQYLIIMKTRDKLWKELFKMLYKNARRSKDYVRMRDARDTGDSLGMSNGGDHKELAKSTDVSQVTEREEGVDEEELEQYCVNKLLALKSLFQQQQNLEKELTELQQQSDEQSTHFATEDSSPEIDSLRALLEDCKASVSFDISNSYSTLLENQRSTLMEKGKDYESMKIALTQSKRELESWKEKEQHMQDEVNRLTYEIGKLKDHISRLEQHRNAAQESENNRYVEYLKEIYTSDKYAKCGECNYEDFSNGAAISKEEKVNDDKEDFSKAKSKQSNDECDVGLSGEHSSKPIGKEYDHSSDIDGRAQSTSENADVLMEAVHSCIKDGSSRVFVIPAEELLNQQFENFEFEGECDYATAASNAGHEDE